MKQLWTHPDNVKELSERLRREEAVADSWMGAVANSWMGFRPTLYPALPTFQVNSSKSIPKDKPTGRYRLRGEPGAWKTREELRDQGLIYFSRFIDYYESDLDHLVFLGVFEEERNMVIYNFDPAPMIGITSAYAPDSGSSLLGRFLANYVS